MPENLKIQGKMNFHLISPTQMLEDTVADKVLIPTKDGGIMILKDRAPLFLSLTPGPLWIYNEGEKPVCYLVSKGIAEIRRNICSVLAWGVRLDKIDPSRASKDLGHAQQELEKMHISDGKAEVQDKIDYYKLLIKGPMTITTPNFK